YVADRNNNRIVVFDKNGNFIWTFGEENLIKPYDITIDNIGRFLILCKDKVWIYEKSNQLWYTMDNIGNRLKRGHSIISDRENNIVITDFDSSRLFVMSLEKQRYSNLNINIERIYSQKFPDVHLAITIEKDDGTNPIGIGARNLSVYENGKNISVLGTLWTEEKNKNNDIMIVYDKSKSMVTYSKDTKTIINNWLQNISSKTNISVVSSFEDNPYIENEFGSSRLSILDSIDNKNSGKYTDKGATIKYAINNMLPRFSKKSLIILTDGKGSGKDFEKFKVEDCVEFAINNDIKFYVVSFREGELTSIYKYISKKTGGDYYRVYQSQDLQDLIKRIENENGREIIVSYVSRSKSRFKDEPISVYLEANYNGMKGSVRSVYYPGR
ncbi:MAG TPA: VWA domain-containing protein, partial [Spirochaetota bacterium]|nr:VWA domain-containing protein [Spirochaetota bacterium]